MASFNYRFIEKKYFYVAKNAILVYLSIVLILIPLLLKFYPELILIRAISSEIFFIAIFSVAFILNFSPIALTANPGKDKASQLVTKGVYFIVLVTLLYLSYLLITNIRKESLYLTDFFTGNLKIETIETKIIKKDSSGQLLFLLQTFNLENEDNKYYFYYPNPLNLREGHIYRFKVIKNNGLILGVE